MITPDTTLVEAVAYAFKKLPTKGTLKKIGIWRPLIALMLGYHEYDNRHTKQAVASNKAEVENVKTFVQAPPTNNRRVYEIAPPPLPTPENVIKRK